MMQLSSTITIKEATKQTWDVIIIGAGPAGSFCAKLLSKKNLKVLLVDKNTHPRDKVCGGCINPRGVSILQQHDLLKELETISIVVKEMLLYSQNHVTHFPLSPGIVVERPALDTILIQQCIKQGVQILLNTAATPNELSKEKASVILNSKDESGVVFGNIIVGASGLPLHSEASLSINKKAYIGVSTTLEQSLFSSQNIHMGIDSNGYVGAVTIKNGKTHIASALSPLFIRDKKGIPLAVKSILEQSGMIQNLKLSKAELSSSLWKGTPSLSRNGIISSTRYFAVGDACGYVEPFTGEGITWALESSLLASSIIEKAAQHWENSYMHEWKQLHKKTIGKHHRFCTLIKNLLRMPRPIINSAMSLALASPSLIKNVSIIIGAKAPSWIEYEN